MADQSQSKDNQYLEALEFINSVVLAFDVETKREGDRSMGGLGLSGCRIFNGLAKKRGAFVRPVPFRYDDLCEDSSLTRGTVTRAMSRLVEQLLVTVSGPRDAPAVMLHLPVQVLAMYARYETRFGRSPVEQHDLEKALALLDQPDFEGYSEREE